MSEQTDHVPLHGKRRRGPKHNWPMHVVVWLDHLARVDPERLRVSSINKLAEAACDHLVTTIGWAPQDP